MADTPKVLITDYAWPNLEIEKQILESAGLEVVSPSGDSQKDLMEAACGVSAIMTNWKTVDKDLIDVSPDLKIVSRMGIGLDNIDTDHCTQKNIAVTNVPDYCVDEVAQHALTFILTLARQVSFHHHQCKEGTYKLDSGNPIGRITNQTVGLVGTGNTARRLAEICLGVGLKVLTYSRSGKSLPGCRSVSWEELLADSDFVSLHIPATAETQKIMNQEAFSKMKKGAYLINIARGALVDEADLIQAIEEGQIGGAGLDVQSPEPPNLNDPLFRHPQVIVTPHAAFWSKESLEDLRSRAATQVADMLTGKVPENIVNSK